MFGYIHTAKGITVIHRNRSVSISTDDVRYPKVLSLINLHEQGDAFAEEELDAALASPKHQLATAIAATTLSARVSVTDTDVLFDGKPAHNTLTTRMLEYLRQGISVVTMVPFLENLMQNPSYRAVQDLYSFLEKGSIPLTTDGHFLAYKYVREDYLDQYSGTFDNSVGKIVEMPRNEVDEDPSRTCSNGLHVCSYEYLPKTPYGQRIVIVKVNPKDVVAIPADYNDTKMRVCRYEVVGELDITDGVRNTLSETLVNDSYAWEVTAYDRNDLVADVETFSSRSEAEGYIEDALDYWWPVMKVTGPGVEAIHRYE